MSLSGVSTIYKHPQASTLYLTIPAKIASDEQFTIKDRDRVLVRFNPKTRKLTVRKLVRTQKKKELLGE